LCCWLTAAIVLTMLMAGTLSQAGPRRPADPGLLRLHTSIGITAYALLWGRVIWRFTVGHPGRLPNQGPISFTVGKYFHFALLVAICVMLISGPLVAWSAANPIQVFAVAIPSPMTEAPGLHRIARNVHGYAGSFIFLGMILHVAAVFKHTVINQDGTFEKIIIP